MESVLGDRTSEQSLKSRQPDRRPAVTEQVKLNEKSNIISATKGGNISPKKDEINISQKNYTQVTTQGERTARDRQEASIQEQSAKHQGDIFLKKFFIGTIQKNFFKQFYQIQTHDTVPVSVPAVAGIDTGTKKIK
jgi:hypothetical protein